MHISLICVYICFKITSVCHRTNIAAPRVLWPHSAQCFPGSGRPATAWLPCNCVSPIRLWGTFRSALCPSIALPCCGSMTTTCCCLCWWPCWESLWIFANWYIYPKSSILLSFYSLCLRRRLLWGCPLKKNKNKKGNKSWYRFKPVCPRLTLEQCCFPLIRRWTDHFAFSEITARCFSHPTPIKPCHVSRTKELLELFLSRKK